MERPLVYQEPVSEPSWFRRLAYMDERERRRHYEGETVAKRMPRFFRFIMEMAVEGTSGGAEKRRHREYPTCRLLRPAERQGAARMYGRIFVRYPAFRDMRWIFGGRFYTLGLL